MSKEASGYPVVCSGYPAHAGGCGHLGRRGEPLAASSTHLEEPGGLPLASSIHPEQAGGGPPAFKYPEQARGPPLASADTSRKLEDFCRPPLDTWSRLEDPLVVPFGHREWYGKLREPDTCSKLDEVL